MNKARQLTTKQEAFKEAIIAGATPIDAARKAEYKGNDNTLSSVATENLLKPAIKEDIDRKRAELSAKVENKAEDILLGIMAIAYPAEDVQVHNGDRLRALELLGKNCDGGMWTDKVAGVKAEGLTINVSERPKLVKDAG